MRKYILLLVWIVASLSNQGWAASPFVVKQIDIQGLQRTSPDTVYNYLPIKTGDTLRPGQTGTIISSLYHTGFFEHISLGRKNNTLIIRVVERPTIGQIKISGNSSLQTDKVTSAMKAVDIAEGRVYNSAILEKIKLSILNQYYMLGRYNAKVDIHVTPMERNRVLVKIDISEGLVAKIRKISILGAHAFNQKTLQKQLDITTPGLITFFTQTDRFSQEKLDTSLEKLRDYYLDRGYIKFNVKSSKVSITPDRKAIYVTIVVDEGDPYTVTGYTVSGETILPKEELLRNVTFKPNTVFSKRKIIETEKSMTDALGEKGYLFTVVSLQPQIDDTNKTLFLNFVIKPGKRVYVRHIFFTDNTKTNDLTLRREIQQMESAPVSSSKLDQSKHRLSLLPYVRNVDMNINPVEQTDDTVDVNYKLTEDNAAQATFSVGYSQLDRIILSAGVTQKNFLGTGKTLGINASNSRFQSFFGINYSDPYYTPDGISRSINLSVSKFNPGAANITRSYSDDQIVASVVYGIPLGQEQNVFNTLQLGYGYQGTLVKLNHQVSNQVLDFVARNGRHFQEANLIVGVSRDSRDKAIFPTSGMLHTLAGNIYLPLTGQSLKYYQLSYNAKAYRPIYGDFIATARADFGYGNAFNGVLNYPFFNNFYAGGIDSVRGYLGNTLGPHDNLGHNGDATGGNILADASVGLIFPNHISENLRTSVFVDGGNVFNSFNNRRFGGHPSGPPRYATGIQADWLTPLGLIDVSLARAINPQKGDNEEIFQFSLGANFG